MHIGVPYKHMENTDNLINIMIEIPAGSSIKYELDEKTGRMYVDRFQPTPMGYPENYGMVEGARSGDGDPADAYVITSRPLHVGSWIRAKVIGMIDTEDEKGHDPKFICVAASALIDAHYGQWEDITDIPKDRLDRLIFFLENHKRLEPGKWVKVHAVLNRDQALAELVKEQLG